MPVIKGEQSITSIYKGVDKIGKIYKGLDLVYQSFVYDPVVALIERTIENVEPELLDDITYIEDSAFARTNLKIITIPSNITILYGSVFRECTSLKTVNIEEGLQEVGAYTFDGCTSLENIILPSTVTFIGTNAFDKCTSLTTMTILATTPPTTYAGTLGTTISTSTTTIYVPSSSVEAYKTADVWKDLTTRETNPVTFIGI